MALSYQQLLHDVAIRMNALIGAQVADIATTYNVSPLTAANFKSADWPFNSFRDAILMAVGDFSWAIADTGQHPWRTYLRGVTTSIAHRGDIPKLDSNSKPIIGLYGKVKDADTGRTLTEKPTEFIERWVANSGGHYVVPVYHFKIDGSTLLHTVDNATMEVCIYDRTTELAAFTAGNTQLPDALEPAITARAVSYMVKSTMLAEKAAFERDYADACLLRIRSGATSIPSKSTPVAVTNARAK